MMKGEFVFVYITAKDKDEARKIGKAIVEKRLTACVNILDGMNSMYWWNGKIEDDNEAVIIAKTKGSLLNELITEVKSVHSYSCPCIVALPVLNGNKDFLDWITNQTK
jgi:periplasmic divalent cation tolerance protein